jgi:hypothetical protein
MLDYSNRSAMGLNSITDCWFPVPAVRLAATRVAADPGLRGVRQNPQYCRERRTRSDRRILACFDPQWPSLNLLVAQFVFKGQQPRPVSPVVPTMEHRGNIFRTFVPPRAQGKWENMTTAIDKRISTGLVLGAGTDEAGHAFQFEAGRVFQSEAGHPWRQSHGSI